MRVWAGEASLLKLVCEPDRFVTACDCLIEGQVYLRV